MRSIQKGDVVGDYRVIEVAGSGGMGAVYKVENLISRRTEAMKLLPPGSSSDADLVQRFEREIQVQARLHHPNIVELYAAVRNGDTVALVMEYVEGESLQRILEAGPLPVETAVEFTGQVLSALSYAHAAGVIHRDVGPANIIVTSGRVAKLTDFGLARGAQDLRLSMSGVPLGSPWYMSPEQVRGLYPLDARSDLYAVGAVLYEMLTGEKMFAAEGAFAVMRAHVEAEPPAPSVRNPTVPTALDEVVRKAVAKDPAVRYQSAEEFGLALLGVTAGVVPMTPARSVRTARVPRWGVAMAAAVPAGLLAAFGMIQLLSPRSHAQAGKRPPVVQARQEAETVAPVVVAPPVVPEAVVVAPEIPIPVVAPGDGVSRRRPVAVRPAATQSFAIRVTGGEAPAVPAVAAAPRVEAPAPKSDAVEATTVVAAPPVEAMRETSATSEAISAEKTPKSGNRFVKALGKINPFRKKTEGGEGKAQLKQ